MLHLKNKAFTMIEMLLVIFIVSLIIFVMLFNMHPLLDDVENTNDIYTITNSFLLLQSLSIKKEEDSSIYFGSNYIECSIDGKSFLKKEINTTVSTNFNANTLKINEDGNLYQGGSVVVGDSKIIFHLGSGSYEIL